MPDRHRFTDLPAYAAVSVNPRNSSASPSDIYQLAEAFREVYEKAKPLSRKVSVPDGFALTHDDWPLVYTIPQALIVQLAFSNELLLKAILLGSSGRLETGHSLKALMSKLDGRYLDYVKNHLHTNDLKKNNWNKVIRESDRIFVTARYGYEKGGYKVDFMTLQLINEALDDIYNNMLPDWLKVKGIIDSEKSNDRLIKEEVDLIFDEEYQAKQRKELEEFRQIFNELSSEKDTKK